MSDRQIGVAKECIPVLLANIAHLLSSWIQMPVGASFRTVLNVFLQISSSREWTAQTCAHITGWCSTRSKYDRRTSRGCGFSEICLCVRLVQLPCLFATCATVSGCFVAVCGRRERRKPINKTMCEKKYKRQRELISCHVLGKKVFEWSSFFFQIPFVVYPAYLVSSTATVCLLLCFFCTPHLLVPSSHLLLQPTAAVNVFKRSSRCTQFFSCWYDTITTINDNKKDKMMLEYCLQLAFCAINMMLQLVND